MIFKYEISTPANTSEANAMSTPMQVSKGIIHKLDVVFPPGCQRLLHVRINRALHQVFPLNPEASFASDAETISFREYVALNAEPYELQTITWNDDETYDHTIIVRLGILRKQIIAPWLINWREKFNTAEDF